MLYMDLESGDLVKLRTEWKDVVDLELVQEGTMNPFASLFNTSAAGFVTGSAFGEGDSLGTIRECTIDSFKRCYIPATRAAKILYLEE